MSWFSRITAGLTKSAANVTEGIKQAIGLAAKLDDATLEALEEALIAADTSLPVAQAILKDLQKAKLPDPLTQEALKQALADLIAARLQPLAKPLDFKASPTVILVAGVNGAGKTTTIGKLAAQWAAEGKDVVVAAADTFRAAAVVQLRVWTDRADASPERARSVSCHRPKRVPTAPLWPTPPWKKRRPKRPTSC